MKIEKARLADDRIAYVLELMIEFSKSNKLENRFINASQTIHPA